MAEAGSRSRSRPCDTCRLRKTRCVKSAAQSQCILCAFHDQRCTFLRGPLPRQQQQRRRQPTAAAANAAAAVSASGDDDDAGHRGQDGAPEPASPPDPPRPGSPSPGRRRPSAAASGDEGGDVVVDDADEEDEDADADADDDESPAILGGTLGLHPAAHAQYVGPTDYRDPMLLDLHRSPPPPPAGDASAAPELARRLDDRTIFVVRPDEAAASEAQRIVDLDAVEAAVRPLGPTLVDLYFRIVHPSFPILHKRVFLSKHRLSHRHFAPSLLAAVYLMALDWQLYDSALAGRQTGALPDAAALEGLVERAIGQDMRRPKLSTVEAGLLLLQRDRGGADSFTWSRAFAAQLVAVAQDLGLHLDCSAWSIPAWEVGLRRRLAWALYAQDRWGALVHGRPFLIHRDDWDVRPCIDADFPELDAGEDSADAVDVDVRVGWHLFLRHLELARLLSDMLPPLYSPAATRPGGALDRDGVEGALELAQPFMLRLREWHAALPETLRLQHRQRGKLCANGSLHLAHASLEVTVHRALVRTLTPRTAEPLRESVRSAARERLRAATELLTSLEPEHTAAFWGRAAAHQVAHIASLAALLWATAETPDEMAWCAARVDELRWALRVRCSAAPFAREALRLLERDIGGFGVVRAQPP